MITKVYLGSKHCLKIEIGKFREFSCRKIKGVSVIYRMARNTSNDEADVCQQCLFLRNNEYIYNVIQNSSCL